MTRYPVISLAAALLCVVTVCGCTSGSSGVKTQDPTVTTSSTSASGTGLTSSSTSESGTPTTPSTTAPKPRPPTEAATRNAVAAAWARFYSTYLRVETPAVPASQRPALVGAVAVNPVYGQVLSEAADFSKTGVSTYGTVTHHPYWPSPVAGKSTVVIGDCMDQSHYGSKSIKTGQKRTVGVARDNTRGTLVLGTDSVWRVQSIKYLVDVRCTP